MDQTRPSETRQADSITSSTASRPGIDISLSLSPTISEQATPSPQQPSQLSSSTDKSTASTGNVVENTSSGSASTEKEPSPAPPTEPSPASTTEPSPSSLTEPSPAEQETKVPTSQPKPACEEGLEYAVYLFKYGSPECAALERTTQGEDPLDLDLATVIENKTPTTAGKYPELDLSDASIDDQCVAVALRGYIALDETGQYTLGVLGTVFDLVYVWHGDTALSGRFEPGNSALRQFRDSKNGALTSASFFESVSNRYTPIRIFMASATLFIWGQISVKSPSDIDSSFVTCPIGENAPVWESWEQERIGTGNPSSTSDVSSVTREISSIAASATSLDEEDTTSTSSSTTTSTPTAVCEDGVEYAVYFFDNDGTGECQELLDTSSSQDPLYLNLAKVINGKVPHATGITPNIDGLALDPKPGEPTTIYDYTTPPDVDASNSCTVVSHRGYLVLSNPDGSYPLTIYGDVDDLIYIWGGDAALSGGYDTSNTIIRKLMGTWNNEQSYYNFGVEEPTKLKRDDATKYIPVRILYASLPGAGHFQLSLYGSPDPQFVTCSGDQNAPSWLPWDQEEVKGQEQQN